MHACKWLLEACIKREIWSVTLDGQIGLFQVCWSRLCSLCTLQWSCSSSRVFLTVPGLCRFSSKERFECLWPFNGSCISAFSCCNSIKTFENKNAYSAPQFTISDQGWLESQRWLLMDQGLFADMLLLLQFQVRAGTQIWPLFLCWSSSMMPFWDLCTSVTFLSSTLQAKTHSFCLWFSSCVAMNGFHLPVCIVLSAW